MRSPQLRRSLTEAATDVLIPAGALEQHGPHLPLATDTIIADAIAGEVVGRAGGLIAAPCLPVGCSDHHLSFAGTASVPPDVAGAYLRAVAITLLGHGFRSAYLFSAHAGNIPALEEVEHSLPPDLRRRVGVFVDWPGQRRALHDWARRALGLGPEEVGSHAGHFETSIMLYLAPDLVDMGAAPRGFIGSVDEASRIMQADGMAAVSDVGVLGDARAATAAAGREYLEVLIASVVSFVTEHRTARPDPG